MANALVGGVGVGTVGDSWTLVSCFGTFVNVNTFDAVACAVNVVTSVLGEFEPVRARAIVTAAKVVADGAVVAGLEQGSKSEKFPFPVSDTKNGESVFDFFPFRFRTLGLSIMHSSMSRQAPIRLR